MDKKVIPPDKWATYLEEFSTRNKGRRARFEAFSHGEVQEENEEAVFESISVSADKASVIRTIKTKTEDRSITDEVTDVRGIAVQLDSDGSDNTMEFMDTNGDLTVLHFESMVDGEN